MMAGAVCSLPVKDIGDRHQVRTSLRQAADPILTRLAERLADLDTGLLLADHHAVVLRRWVADRSILTLLDSVNSNVGYNVAEDIVGTNGVGSVVETGHAMQITGPEHLSTLLSKFTCVGAPIHHPVTRRLEGVITLSCLSDASNALLTPLLTSSAQDIEHRMLEQASLRERILLDAYMTASKSRRAPVAAVGQELFLAGPHVTELLRDIDQAMLWEYVRAVASGSAVDSSSFGFSADDLRIASCRPVESDGEVIGTIVEFDTSRRDTQPSGHLVAVKPADSRPGTPLPGSSVALAKTIAHAHRLAEAATSILITGETGTGKLTLAEAVLTADPSTLARLDMAALDVGGPLAVVAALRAELELRPTVLLLRHLESLSVESAGAAAATIEQFTTPEWRPRLVGTLTVRSDDSPMPPGLQRLTDVIAVGRVVIPPLRDRREDVSEAAKALLKLHTNGRALTISSGALRILMCAPWPGNMRELDSVIRGLVSTASGFEILPQDLSTDLHAHVRRRQLSTMEQLELSTILEALRRNQGNKLAAARDIGLSRSTLYRKLRSYHLDPDRVYF
jgi:transcriptional regulator of acetoin/glycerol metabolism